MRDSFTYVPCCCSMRTEVGWQISQALRFLMNSQDLFEEDDHNPYESIWFLTMLMGIPVNLYDFQSS